MSLTIGVTGGKGFIGHHLVDALQAAKCGRVEVYEHRLEDEIHFRPFVDRNEVIFHLAGVNRADSPLEIARGNLLPCFRLLAAARGQNKWIIFSSSRQEGTPYAWSKQICEDMLEEESRHGKLSVNVLRIPNVYGPGCRPFYNSVVATFCFLLAEGKAMKDLPIHGEGADRREYLYVAELVRQLVSIVKGPRPKGFERQVLEGQDLSVREISEILTDGKKMDKHPYLKQTLMAYRELR